MVKFGHAVQERMTSHGRAIPTVRSSLPTIWRKGYPQEQSRVWRLQCVSPNRTSLTQGHSREDIKDTTECEHRSNFWGKFSYIQEFQKSARAVTSHTLLVARIYSFQ
jgi:hypothetical protein